MTGFGDLNINIPLILTILIFMNRLTFMLSSGFGLEKHFNLGVSSEFFTHYENTLSIFHGFINDNFYI